MQAVRPRRSVRGVVGLLCSALAVLLVAQPAASATTVAPAVVGPRVTFHEAGHAWGAAVLLTHSGDGTGRLFVVDKVGIIRGFVPGHRSFVYLDLRSKVKNGGEQGMLGLAFYPTFKTVPLVYVTYTNSAGALQVSRFRLPSYLTTSINPALEEHVITISHPTYGNHNGGMIAFGKEGFLYVSTGDGGGAGDPFAHAQSLGSLNGKILRLDPRRYCGVHPYCTPTSNPFYGQVGRWGEIWDYGLRNPWRFSFDKLTGDLWIADVGQDAYEEVDHSAAGVGGLNYGWSCREALSTYNASRCSGTATYTSPNVVVPHPSGEAIIGGPVYRGAAYSAVIGGDYIFGDYVTGTVWADSPTGRVTIVGALSGVTSIDTNEAGEIWATTLDGRLWTMTAA